MARGARPGTDIYDENAAGDYIKAGDAAFVCASSVAMADTSAAPPAAPPAAEEPDAKRARGSDGRFSAPAAPDAAVAAAMTDGAALPSVLDAVASHVKDPAMLQALYGAVSGLLSNLDVSSAELAKLREANAALERTKMESDDSARASVKQITRVLNSLYRTHANTELDDARTAVLEEAFIKFPKLNEALQPIVVAASNVEAALLRAERGRADDELAAAKAQVGALFSKLSQYQRLSGVPAVQPDWQATAPAAVEVAASGHGVPPAAAAPAAPVAVNPVLAGLKAYVDSAHNSRVHASDFARTLPKAAAP